MAENAAGDWQSWTNAVLGLWILVTPFVLSGDIGSGAPMWNNVVVGAIIATLAGWSAYE